MNSRKIFLTSLLSLSATLSYAQWTIGAYGGTDWTHRSLNACYDTSISREVGSGITGGIMSQYNILPWFGIRADINMQSRNFSDKKGLANTAFLETSYKMSYITIPVMGSFSYDANNIRLYANAGGYVSFTGLSGETLINYGKFDAGIVCGVGVGYRIYKQLFVNVELMDYVGMVDSHKTGSQYFKQPSHDNVLTLQAGLTYVFTK